MPGELHRTLLALSLALSTACGSDPEPAASVAQPEPPSVELASAGKAKLAAKPAMPPPADRKAQTAADPAEDAKPRLERLQWQPLPVAELPAEPKRLGKVVKALRWSEPAGERAAAFIRSVDSESGRAQLQVLLWDLRPSGLAKLLREVKDGIADCEFDLYADFIEEAFWLTDLDADGVDELTFAYRQTCTSDVSPFTLKLLMLEGTDKYALRGTTIVDVGAGERVGGDQVPDARLAQVPVFAMHAKRVWTDVVALPPW